VWGSIRSLDQEEEVEIEILNWNLRKEIQRTPGVMSNVTLSPPRFVETLFIEFFLAKAGHSASLSLLHRQAYYEQKTLWVSLLSKQFFEGTLTSHSVSMGMGRTPIYSFSLLGMNTSGITGWDYQEKQRLLEERCVSLGLNLNSVSIIEIERKEE